MKQNCKISAQIHEKISKILQNSEKWWKISKNLQNSKKHWQILINFENSVSLYSRFWKMLKNEYLIAKFGLDTAENEPCQVCPARASPSSSGGLPVPAENEPPTCKVSRKWGVHVAERGVMCRARCWARYPDLRMQSWSAILCFH